jgi:hypothetical protein
LTLTAGQLWQARAMYEDRGPGSLEAKLLEILARYPDVRGYHGRDSRLNPGASGFPDWVLAGPGGAAVRELKSEDGVLSGEQRAWGRLMRAAGWDWQVWRPSDLLSGRIEREIAEIARR